MSRQGRRSEDSWEPHCVPPPAPLSPDYPGPNSFLREINFCFKAAAVVCLCDSQSGLGRKVTPAQGSLIVRTQSWQVREKSKPTDHKGK